MLNCIRNLAALILGLKLEFKCGHKSPVKKEIKSFTKIRETTDTITAYPDKCEFCPDCIEKAAIRCAWCGTTILPGHLVTLYLTDGNKVPEHAVEYIHETGEESYIGCMCCADSGADFQGKLGFDSKVVRIASPYEQILASM